MLNGDKAHIYKILDHVKFKLMEEAKSLAQEDTLQSRSGNPSIVETRNLQSKNMASILLNMSLFKSGLINEIEGSSESSFDLVLIEVEKKCVEWKFQQYSSTVR